MEVLPCYGKASVATGFGCCREKVTTARSFYKTRCCVRNEPLILQASSMQETYNKLAQRLLSASSSLNKKQEKYLVAVAGPPGAGKSTLAKQVAFCLNQIQADMLAIAVPMDGFHLYRYQLDMMENPKEAHARRGAPWTFNAKALVDCLQKLRCEGFGYFPSFDHGVGDPIERDIYVSPLHQVILVEGNYLLLGEGDWKPLAKLFDEKWFIMIDTNKAMERVEKRHIATGKAPEIAEWRVMYNDRPNAELVQNTKDHATLIINSINHE